MAISLGAFELEARVAGQAISEVWRAAHRATGRPAAVKFVRPPTDLEERFRARFAHEVRAAAALDHPLIVRLFDHGVVDAEQSERVWIAEGTPYLVMEWLPGPSLEADPPADWPGVRGVLLRLLDTLAHAHARRVVHRDVKPANVLMAPRGPVLTDFGIALLDTPADRRSDEESLIGTPPYMAPEQVRGDWRAVGPWTDLYALGCTAFELVCGRKAFSGPSLLAVLERHLSGERARFAPSIELPPGVEGFIDRLLAPDPARRFRFAADAALALRQIGPTREGAPVYSLPPEDDIGWAAGPGPDGRPPLPAENRQRETGPLFPLLDAGGNLFGLRRVMTVGRSAERAWMWRALARVIQGDGLRAVGLEGAAGMGKSHLAGWLKHRAHALGLAETLTATHAPGGGAASGVGAMLCRSLRCGDADPAARHDRLAQRFPADLAAALTAALDPAGRFDDPYEPVVLDSGDERYATLAAALAALAEQRPLVLHLDDVQWGEETLRLALYLLRRRPHLPALLLLTVRPDALVPGSAIAGLWRQLRRHDRIEPIRLGPLSPPDQTRQIGSLIDLDPALAGRLQQSTAGSPLLAEETIRLWLSSNALVPGPAGAVLKAPGAVPMPQSLGSVWLSRVDIALGGAETRAGEAFELAAVMGVEVERRIWVEACAVAGLALPQIGLTRMHADRLIRTTEDGRWCFVHGALAEALVARARRQGRWRAWNRYAAMVLIREAKADPEQLARHQIAARRDAQAAETLLRAFDGALLRADPSAARRALVMRARVLRTLEVPPEAAPWVLTRVLRARMARRFGQMEVARRWSRRAEPQARALGDPALHAEALSELGTALRLTASDAEGWPLLAEAVQRAEQAGDRELLGRVRFKAAACLNLLGRRAEARRLLRAGLDAAEDVGDLRTEGDCLVGLADIARRQGALDEARDFIDEAYRRYKLAGHRLGRAMVASVLGDLSRYAGDLDAAEQFYTESRALYAAVDAVDLPIAETNLALVCFARGRVAEARRRLEAARRMAWAGHELRVLIHALLLPVVATLGDWAAWDGHMGAIGPLLEGRVGEPDAAEAAQTAAVRAEAAGQPDRARDARRLAIAQYERLGRREEAAAIREAARIARLCADGSEGASEG